MKEPSIDRQWLLDPGNNLRVCAAYISWQADHKDSRLDPVKVLAAYNAGGLYRTNGNPWRLRSQGDHIDRGIAWFNDCIALWAAEGGAPANSLYAIFNAQHPGKSASGGPAHRGVLRAVLDLFKWIMKGR